MSQQALRSAGGRIKPDVVAVRTFVRQFSTTQLRADDNSSNKGDTTNPTPASGRERSRVAASQINDLLRSGPRKNVAAADDKPKVIDIKSAPRGLGTNFVKMPVSFRGRGGGPSGLGRGGAFGGRGGFAGRGRGGFGARGRGAGRGRGGRGGGRGGKRRDGEEAEEEEDENEMRKRMSVEDQVEKFCRAETEEELAYVSARETGVEQAFVPSVSAASLLGYAPSLAIGSSPAANASVVMRGLRDVAGNVFYTPDRKEAVQRTARDLAFKGNGVHFWSDLSEKKRFIEAVKATPEEKQSDYVKIMRGADLEKGAEKAVRDYIVDRAIKGKHETPVAVTVGQAPLEVAAQMHLKNRSYYQADAKKFDDKVASLMAKSMAKRAPGAGKPATA